MSAQIRLASVGDAPAVLEIYGPVIENTVISFEYNVPTLDEIAHRIQTYTQTCPWLVYESDSQVIGYVYANPYRVRAAYQWSVEVSAYIHADHHRKGIGRTLYTALFTLLRMQGFVNAFAGMTLPNEGSVGLHKALGFTPIGVYKNVGYKFGAWHDVMWWQLDLQPPKDDPTPPLKPSVLVGTEEWKNAIRLESD